MTEASKEAQNHPKFFGRFSALGNPSRTRYTGTEQKFRGAKNRENFQSQFRRPSL